jgi:putative zinc finger protein
MKHSYIKSILYEFVRAELPPAEMAEVAAHLGSCERCTREVAEIREIVTLSAGNLSAPSDQRSPEYWNRFAASVERRIESSSSGRIGRGMTVLDDLAAFFTLRPRALAVFGTALGAVVLTLLLFRIGHTPSEEPAKVAQIEEGSAPVVPADNRIGDYFRKSKVLLVGITHLKTDDDQQLDLTRESRVSRELLDDARYLKNQPLDLRSARLIDDLQKILVELANIKEHEGLPNVDIIRSGIHRENLLFKIRMAEASCDSTRFVPVRDTY